MYAYVFDSFVQEKKFQSESARVESRLSSLGIQGRQEKITILKSLQDAARTMIKRGADTVVAVGNDQTIAKLLPIIIEEDVALGIIPIGPNQQIARALGIPEGVGAVNMLSRRIMRRIDLGRAGSAHFILHATLPSNSRITCDDRYSVEATVPEARVALINMGWPGINSRPDDGLLELVVEGGTGGKWFGHSGGDRSVFPLHRAAISRGGEGEIILDGQMLVKAPVEIEVIRKKLHVIVGSERSFE